MLELNDDGSLTEKQRVQLMRLRQARQRSPADTTEIYRVSVTTGKIFKKEGVGWYFTSSPARGKYFTNYWYAWAFALKLKERKCQD